MSGEPGEVRLLRAELLDAHRELVRLRTQTEQLIASNRELSGLLSSSAERFAELLKVVVAFRRLLESTDADAAWANVADILVNVIGTEDFAVLAIGDGPALRPVSGTGVTYERVVAEPPTLSAIRDGAGSAHTVPLYLGSRVAGVILIGALLSHRDVIGAADQQVLDLLSRFAAPAALMAGDNNGWAAATG